MGRPKEVGKVGDLAGYAMAPTISEIAQKGDKEEERRATHLRPLSSTAMVKAAFEL